MPKTKTTYAYKIQSIVKEFHDEFMESINNQFYCNLCNRGFLKETLSCRFSSKYDKTSNSVWQ